MRTVGRVTRARALTVRSPVSRVPFRVVASPGVPRLVARAAWQADEAIVKGKPSYADTLRMAHVHHTAGTNTYTRLQAPAVVRAIQLYHVKGNGWNDIGYNALVDRFGTVYEGRAGGIDRNVVGAHARGFNTGSFGIAVMGDFRTVDPPAAAVDALVRTLAWRLDLAHVDPLSTFNGISSGNERFGVGIPVFLRAISGHRDTGLTTCPGERLYARLGDIARRVAALGLPKLYAPLVAADESGGIRFRARVSSALAVVGRRDRRRRARSSPAARAPGQPSTGRGDPPAPVLAGTRWRIETPGATSAEGTLGGTTATADPAARPPRRPRRRRSRRTPTGRRTRRRSPSRSPSTRTSPCRSIDAAGATVAELESRRWRRAGQRSLAFDGGALARRRLPRPRRGAGDRRARRRPSTIPVVITRAIGRVALSSPCADAERRRQRRHRLDRRPAHRPGDALRAHPSRRQVGRDALLVGRRAR